MWEQSVRNLEGPSRDGVLLVARVLLASLFLIAGFDKATNLPHATAFMATTHAPLPAVAAAISAAVELAGGAALLFGLWTRWAALLFAVYVPITAFIGHPYWLASGAAHDNMLFHFWKNIALCGGFLLLYLEGPGRLSFDDVFEQGLRDLHASEGNRTPAAYPVRRTD